MAEIVFWTIAALTIMSAAFVVLNSQLIYSAVALLFTLFGVAGIYVFLWADFIAGIQILGYVGGILVLVIFGIMLTNKIKSVRISHKSMQQGVGGVVSFWFFIFLFHFSLLRTRILLTQLFLSYPIYLSSFELIKLVVEFDYLRWSVLEI